MDDESELIARYLPLIDAELRRIGFTADDFRYLGSGGQLTPERFEATLAELRQIPSGIGAIAYYARYGVDLATIKRDVQQRESE
jgi:hypothetical protein